MATRNPHDWLALDDETLLKSCQLDVYKASGPGGQHRNKVSSAVRLRHEPTGVIAHGDESRSQHDNKRKALKRLRANIACQKRTPIDLTAPLPDVVNACIFTPRGKGPAGRKLAVGAKDHRFWLVAAYLLDVLDATQGRLADVAAHLNISTGNCVSFFKSHRHLFAAAQALRKAHGQKALR
jgi:hypothetical protein